MRDMARHNRDEIVRAEWQRRWDAGEHNIIVWRGKDGEMHIYTSKQFGPGRAGHGPTVGGKVGWIIWIVGSLVMFAGLTFAVLAGPGDAPRALVTYFIVAPLLLAAYGVKGLRGELRARQLRLEAGLPEPISSRG